MASLAASMLIEHLQVILPEYLICAKHSHIYLQEAVC